MGYCFVNVEPEGIDRFVKKLQGARLTNVSARKRVDIKYGTVQGVDANIEAYRNAAVMELPEAYRPVLLKNGVKLPFPPPNKHKSEWFHEKKGVSTRKVTGQVYRSTFVKHLSPDNIIQSV